MSNRKRRRPVTGAADTRPRYLYRLPDGRVIRVIHDHGEDPKPCITYSMGNGNTVTAWLADLLEARRA